MNDERECALPSVALIGSSNVTRAFNNINNIATTLQPYVAIIFLPPRSVDYRSGQDYDRETLSGVGEAPEVEGDKCGADGHGECVVRNPSGGATLTQCLVPSRAQDKTPPRAHLKADFLDDVGSANPERCVYEQTSRTCSQDDRRRCVCVKIISDFQPWGCAARRVMRYVAHGCGHLSEQMHDQSRVLCLVRSHRGERQVPSWSSWWCGLRVVSGRRARGSAVAYLEDTRGLQSALCTVLEIRNVSHRSERKSVRRRFLLQI